MATGIKVPRYAEVASTLSRDTAIKYRDDLIRSMDATALTAASIQKRSLFNDLKQEYQTMKKLD